jgi:hypothetical protein
LRNAVSVTPMRRAALRVDWVISGMGGDLPPRDQAGRHPRSGSDRQAAIIAIPEPIIGVGSRAPQREWSITRAAGADQMASNTIPSTTNEAWGFFGTISHHADANTAWPIAVTAISTATGLDVGTVATFLDTRHGHHFADDVTNELAAGKPITEAIAAATARWMAWRISPRTAHETGIPRGLLYLTGFALHAAIEADCED